MATPALPLRRFFYSDDVRCAAVRPQATPPKLTMAVPEIYFSDRQRRDDKSPLRCEGRCGQPSSRHVAAKAEATARSWIPGELYHSELFWPILAYSDLSIAPHVHQA